VGQIPWRQGYGVITVKQRPWRERTSIDVKNAINWWMRKRYQIIYS
jgi:hypothetical protein